MPIPTLFIFKMLTTAYNYTPLVNLCTVKLNKIVQKEKSSNLQLVSESLNWLLQQPSSLGLAR